jgi:hypothetical protein
MEDQKNTAITDETGKPIDMSKSKSLWPWIIGGLVLFIVVVGVAGLSALKNPVDNNRHVLTAADLEQLTYESKQEERAQRQAETSHDKK